MPTPRWLSMRRGALAFVAIAIVGAGCAPRRAPGTAARWLVGREAPAFEPDGPRDATRWMLERLLTRGLAAEDSSGRVALAAARAHEVSDDGLIHTFHLSPDLAFTDGTPCRSVAFRRALEAGLQSSTDGTRAWLLAAVRGMDKIRPGRPLPPLGIETPDSLTLVLRLARPDSLLLAKLAIPGVSAAWKERAGTWTSAVGLGPYRVAGSDGDRALALVRLRPDPSRPDTIHVRFVPGAARTRDALRRGSADLVWPVPNGLLADPLPSGYRAAARDAVPARRLLLVMRVDLPPTLRLPTRHALAHALNRGDILTTLGTAGTEFREWLAGAGPFEFPRLDPAEVQLWMERGKLGRSFHVVLVYDPQSPAADVARELQGEWARLAIYVELHPLRGRALEEEDAHGTSHLVLAEMQSAMADPVADLATLVMPLRGPAVGGIRTGWRTREFDPWLAPRRPPPELPTADVQRRLEEELIALPLARLPWLWIERTDGAGVDFDPRLGPIPRHPEVVSGRGRRPANP